MEKKKKHKSNNDDGKTSFDFPHPRSGKLIISPLHHDSAFLQIHIIALLILCYNYLLTLLSPPIKCDLLVGKECV